MSKTDEIQIFLNWTLNNDEIRPMEKMIEYSSKISEDPDIESTVMRYAHGECHTFTAMLEYYFRNYFNLHLMGVFRKSDDSLVHSLGFLYESNIYLDVNGLHNEESILETWKSLARDDVYIDDMFEYEFEEIGLDAIIECGEECQKVFKLINAEVKNLAEIERGGGIHLG